MIKQADIPSIPKGYDFTKEIIAEIKDRAMKIVHQIPRYSYIQETDFSIAISETPAPREHDDTNPTHTLARCYYIPPIIQGYLKAKTRESTPYFILLYPIFFKLPSTGRNSQEHTIAHELCHIKKNKKGCQSHWGFGDEDILEHLPHSTPL